MQCCFGPINWLFGRSYAEWFLERIVHRGEALVWWLPLGNTSTLSKIHPPNTREKPKQSKNKGNLCSDTYDPFEPSETTRRDTSLTFVSELGRDQLIPWRDILDVSPAICDCQEEPEAILFLPSINFQFSELINSLIWLTTNTTVWIVAFG